MTTTQGPWLTTARVALATKKNKTTLLLNCYRIQELLQYLFCNETVVGKVQTSPVFETNKIYECLVGLRSIEKS